MLSVRKKVMRATAKTINPTVFRGQDFAILSFVRGNTRKPFKNQMAVP
jgi:hypothetical protein